MTYTEAKLQMIKGAKVKLPEWIGYWWLPGMVDGGENDIEKRIRELDRNGNIIIPDVTAYVNRKDWQVTNGKFGFEFVILALKNGKRVTCGELGSNWLELKALSVKETDISALRQEILRCAPEKFSTDNKITSVVYQVWSVSSRWLLYEDYELYAIPFEDIPNYTHIYSSI